MSPIKHSFSGTIAAPIDDVFRALTDPKRIPDWLPACADVQVPGPALAKGTRFKFHLDTGRGRREVLADVIEYAPPTLFGWAETNPRRNTKTLFRLQFNGASTGILMQQVSAPRGFLARIRTALFTRRRTARLFERSLQNLQKILML
jgi:uncharacterized protein YndB with AHSA1/START domain